MEIKNLGMLIQKSINFIYKKNISQNRWHVRKHTYVVVLSKNYELTISWHCHLKVGSGEQEECKRYRIGKEIRWFGWQREVTWGFARSQGKGLMGRFSECGRSKEVRVVW